MPKIRPPKKYNLIIVFSVIRLIIVTSLMSFIVFLLFRLKRQNDQDYYDDQYIGAVFYDTVEEAEYEDPYQINDNNRTSIQANKSRKYLQITNNYI